MTDISKTTLDSASRDLIRKAYSKSGQQYDRVRLQEPRGRLLSDHDIRIFEEILARVDPALNTLEVGAGTGRFTLPLLAHGFSVTATDLNQAMLGELEAKVAELGDQANGRCHIQVENVFQLSFPDASFDFVYSLHVIPRFLTWEDQRSALREIARIVKPGGLLLFNYRNKRSFYNLAYRGPAATPEQIEATLADAGFQVECLIGKWWLNKTLLKQLPMPANRALAALDWRWRHFLPRRAWDVFVLARAADIQP
ncbi:MAG: class I SAM-dependent methyltransferase [Planctomycetota bacterium]